MNPLCYWLQRCLRWIFLFSTSAHLVLAQNGKRACMYNSQISISYVLLYDSDCVPIVSGKKYMEIDAHLFLYFCLVSIEMMKI